VHGGDLYDPSKPTSPHRHGFLRAPIRGLLTRADAVVAQSRDTAQNVARIYGVERPVELVPLGIARPPARVRAHRSAYGIPESAFVMATVGRMVARKATSQLVRVLANAGRPDMYLLVVGDGPESDDVAKLATQLGVSDRVKMLGHVTERQKYAALSMSDIFVSTSQHEGFGLVFLEAMAFGLPVVCYNRGGQVDFLSTPTTGAVVSLNDEPGFTRAVLDLYLSPERRADIRKHNLTAVEAYFIDRCARRYESIFEQAITAHADALEPARQK
jgi:glycosyltransferase involved in cell wall biosynthesis